MPDTSLVILRNLTIRNFLEGVQIKGNSHVLIDNCVFENNRDYGIHVLGNARVTVLNTRVLGTGRRIPVSGSPSPGNGIDFASTTKGRLADVTVMMSIGIGIVSPAGRVQGFHLTSFDNDIKNYAQAP